MMANNDWLKLFSLEFPFLDWEQKKGKKSWKFFFHILLKAASTYFTVYRCVSVHVWIFSHVDIWMSEGWRPFCRLKLLNLCGFQVEKYENFLYTCYTLYRYLFKFMDEKRWKNWQKALFFFFVVERHAWWHKERKILLLSLYYVS